MINNRQNGRRRGRSGNGQRAGNPGNAGGGSRIDNRARGNANQLYEKYKNLARDAQMSGDRVNTEYYLQFADHYFRVLSENRPRMEDGSQRRIAPVDSFDDFDGDDEYGDEGEPVRAGEQGSPMDREAGARDAANRDQRREAPVQGRYRDEGERDEAPRGAPSRDGSAREAGPRVDGQRDGGRRDGNRFRDDGRRRDESRPIQAERADEASGGNGREAGWRDQSPQRDDDRRRDEGRPGFSERPAVAAEAEAARGDDDRLALTGSPVANDPGEDSPDGAEPTPIMPRRRGRPRRDAAAAPAPAGDEPVAIEADRLPPSLALSPSTSESEEEPRPRRRRTRAATTSEVPSVG